MDISLNIWKVVFAVVAAVASYLLAQTQVPLQPIVQVVLGAVLVALAVINGPTTADNKTNGSN